MELNSLAEKILEANEEDVEMKDWETDDYWLSSAGHKSQFEPGHVL